MSELKQKKDARDKVFAAANEAKAAAEAQVNLLIYLLSIKCLQSISNLQHAAEQKKKIIAKAAAYEKEYADVCYI